MSEREESLKKKTEQKKISAEKKAAKRTRDIIRRRELHKKVSDTKVLQENQKLKTYVLEIVNKSYFLYHFCIFLKDQCYFF